MLNNNYFKIYNKSFDIFYKNLEFYLNDDKESFKKKYEIINSKKITGYMLYVREYYKKNNTSNKNSKKNISEQWDKLENKEIYNNKAKEILNYYNKLIDKKVKIKKNKIEKKEDNINKDEVKELSYELTKINIDDKEYYIDGMNNIIDIEKEKYIGYLNEKNKIIVI